VGGGLGGARACVGASETLALPEIRDCPNTVNDYSKKNFRPLSVIIPPHELLQRYVEQVEPVYQKIALNETHTRTLAALRDTLLPKLLSGEVGVGGESA
jgi:type I restriction enzyme S subunit